MANGRAASNPTVLSIFIQPRDGHSIVFVIYGVVAVSKIGS